MLMYINQLNLLIEYVNLATKFSYINNQRLILIECASARLLILILK